MYTKIKESVYTKHRWSQVPVTLTSFLGTKEPILFGIPWFHEAAVG